MDLGLLADGSLQVPPSGFPAGWYTGGPTPGELGPAVIAGHIGVTKPGVFFNLHQLKAGELVTVKRADGTRLTFRISRVAQYPKDQFPTAAVYGNLNHPGLRLITCGGTFTSQTGHHLDNIVVFADLIASTG
jgi:LPXTG-site transpeptidase (sortase) family protein